jgi:hypothetical protein
MDREKEWKAFWKIKAPGKMLIHLWRFAHDCLPSGAHLCKRKIPVSGLCTFCDLPEGIEHAMLTCQFARMVWQEVKKHCPIKLERKGFRSPMRWLFDFLARSSELQAYVLAVGFWLIWEARNDKRNEGTKPDPKQTSGKILAYVELIRANLYKTSRASRCESNAPSTTWTPPPPGSFLVNSDATLFEEAKRMGEGVILRNYLGTCLGADRFQLQGFTSPEHAEALALQQAVSFAQDKGLNKVIFASDYLSLIQRMNSSLLDWSPVGILTGKIKSMSSVFTEVSFIHVKRCVNEAAHALAKSCRNLFSSEVFNSVPDFIRGTLCIDVV